MNKVSKFLIILPVFLNLVMILAVPHLVGAAGLVPCGDQVYPPGHKTIITPSTYDPNTNYTSKEVSISDAGQVSNPCDFKFFLTLINNIIHFILYSMAIPIAAIMFAYAGFELITSGGEASKRTQAKNIFLNTVIGLALAVAAFLIVKTILSILGFNAAGFLA